MNNIDLFRYQDKTTATAEPRPIPVCVAVAREISARIISLLLTQALSKNSPVAFPIRYSTVINFCENFYILLRVRLTYKNTKLSHAGQACQMLCYPRDNRQEALQ